MSECNFHEKLHVFLDAMGLDANELCAVSVEHLQTVGETIGSILNEQVPESVKKMLVLAASIQQNEEEH